MDQRTKHLVTSINKLLKRGADKNIRQIIKKSHDADIASLLELLDTNGRISVFQLIPERERQANILSHINKKYQLEIAHVFEISKIQELIGEMDSDDAADLLGHLPDELSQQVLSGLNKEELQEVEELMSYAEDSAGGLMSSEFLTISESLTVRESIEKIQSMDEDLISFYIYVVSAASRLVGVLSLKQLLLSRPSDLLKDIMSTDVISVELSTLQSDVAKIVEKYDFLSLPVTNENQVLMGVITVDDVIDVIREEAAEDIQAMGMGGASLDESFWVHIKSRLPWLLISFAGGAFCYFMIWITLNPFKIDFVLQNSICLLPLAFFLVSTLSSQTVTMIVGYLRTHPMNSETSWLDLKKELLIGVSLTLLSTAIFLLFTFSFQGLVTVPIVLSLVLTLQMLLTLLISISIPLFIGRLNFDPIYAAPSIAMILSNVIAVGILVFYYAVW